MSKVKSSRQEMDIPPFFPRKRTKQMIPIGFKGKNFPINNEHILELNVKAEILNQINAEKDKNKALFPTRPLMDYSWHTREGRVQEPYLAEDRLYRNLRNTPPSIYEPYSSESSTEFDPIRRNRNRHFPSLKCNLGYKEMKPRLLFFWNSESAKPPLPRLSSFPCPSCVTEGKTDTETAGIFEKHKLRKRLPFSGVQVSSKSVSRKKERIVSLAAPEILEIVSRNSGFCVKGERFKQNDAKAYIPSSTVSHNEYMAHFQNDSDESDED